MSLYTDQDALKFLERIAIALETLAKSGGIPTAAPTFRSPSERHVVNLKALDKVVTEAVKKVEVTK